MRGMVFGVSTSRVCHSMPYEPALTPGPPTSAIRGGLTKWIFSEPKLVVPVHPDSTGAISAFVSRPRRSSVASRVELLFPLRMTSAPRANVRSPTVTASSLTLNFTLFRSNSPAKR